MRKKCTLAVHYLRYFSYIKQIKFNARNKLALNDIISRFIRNSRDRQQH